MTRKVYLSPAWKMHEYGRQMVAYPPPGYECMANNTVKEQMINRGGRWGGGPFLLQTVDRVLPPALAKAWLERRKKAPDGVALTYSWDHVVFRPEPWIIEVEYASLVLGSDPKHLRRFKRTMETALNSPHCRIIRCWAEVGRWSLLADLDPQGFEHKIEVVHFAVPPRAFAKEDGNDKVKLLFVGSGTSSGGFDYRGGREVLEVFAVLRQRYPNLELVVRSDIPRDVRARYGGMEGLRIIDDFVSRERLDQEFKSADIFFFPSHNTPAMCILDAMSYELPVVSLDAWANSEYIDDGKTGFVAKRSKTLPYFYQDTAQPNWAAPAFVAGMRQPDPAVVQDLAAKVGRLIEDRDLRRRMGKAGRWEVDHGKFSLAATNRELGLLFDRALSVDER